MAFKIGDIKHIDVILMTLNLATLIRVIRCDVVIPPVINVHHRAKEFFILHQDVTLVCQASGHPTPRYNWSKDGEILDHYDDRYQYTDGELTIRQANSEDEGSYHCWAENQGGTDRSSPTRLILAFLEPFTESEQYRPWVDQGASIKLPCVAPDSAPPANITWTIRTSDNTMTPADHIEGVITDLGGDLHILNMGSSTVESYTCVAFNPIIRTTVKAKPIQITMNPDSIGHDSGRSVILRWHNSPVIGLVGNTIKLQCIFDGNPPPVISWSFERIPQQADRWSSSGTTLEISELMASDSGVYECVAFNELSLQPVKQQIHVTVQELPMFIKVPSSINITVGESLTQEFIARGIPKPDITCYSNWNYALDARTNMQIRNTTDQSESDTAGVSVHVTSALLGDTMVIGCMASNIQGSVYTSSYISVTVVLQHTPIVASSIESIYFSRWTMIGVVSSIILVS